MVETALHASLLTRQVHRPDLLLVSALLHDMGKGLPGDHSIIGAEIIKPILQRMGFPENDVSVVETLVMHHLLLSTVATRRDLDDPTTINSVCELISDPLTIELLHALSISDGQATGNTAWSNWKASLVADLVNRVKKQISGVGLPPQPEFSESEKDLAKSGEVHLSLIKRDEITELLIIAPDRPGLLSIVAGFLTISRLNVRSARTRTFANSAVMRWLVLPDVYAPDISESALKQSLVQTLNGEVDIAAKINERVSSYRSASPIPVPPPIVEVIHDGATEATVLDVRSHDQMGLLYLLGKAVTEAGVDVRAAIVSTLGAEACDSLYITEVDGRPLDPKRALEVAQSIEQQLRAYKI
jgi:[protein-PII] uridylyltransferase